MNSFTSSMSAMGTHGDFENKYSQSTVNFDNYESDADLKTKKVIKAWSEAEDDRLLELIKIYGTNSWSKITEMIPGKTGKQCGARWMNCLNPSLVKGEWTPAEDEIIISMNKVLGNRWSKIASALSGRSQVAVKNRFYSLTNAHNHKRERELLDIYYLGGLDPVTTSTETSSSSLASFDTDSDLGTNGQLSNPSAGKRSKAQHNRHHPLKHEQHQQQRHEEELDESMQQLLLPEVIVVKPNNSGSYNTSSSTFNNTFGTSNANSNNDETNKYVNSYQQVNTNNNNISPLYNLNVPDQCHHNQSYNNQVQVQHEMKQQHSPRVMMSMSGGSGNVAGEMSCRSFDDSDWQEGFSKDWDPLRLMHQSSMDVYDNHGNFDNNNNQSTHVVNKNNATTSSAPSIRGEAFHQGGGNSRSCFDSNNYSNSKNKNGGDGTHYNFNINISSMYKETAVVGGNNISSSHHSSNSSNYSSNVHDAITPPTPYQHRLNQQLHTQQHPQQFYSYQPLPQAVQPPPPQAQFVQHAEQQPMHQHQQQPIQSPQALFPVPGYPYLFCEENHPIMLQQQEKQRQHQQQQQQESNQLNNRNHQHYNYRQISVSSYENI